MYPTAAPSLAWMSQGACQGEDPELFFPVTAKGPALRDIRRAKAVCGRCGVRLPCLRYALENRQSGIWGGTTEDERRVMRVRPPAGVPMARRAEPVATR